MTKKYKLRHLSSNLASRQRILGEALPQKILILGCWNIQKIIHTRVQYLPSLRTNSNLYFFEKRRRIVCYLRKNRNTFLLPWNHAINGLTMNSNRLRLTSCSSSSQDTRPLQNNGTLSILYSATVCSKNFQLASFPTFAWTSILPPLINHQPLHLSTKEITPVHGNWHRK